MASHDIIGAGARKNAKEPYIYEKRPTKETYTFSAATTSPFVVGTVTLDWVRSTGLR